MVLVPQLTLVRDDMPKIDSAYVLVESAALEHYFQNSLRHEGNTDNVEGSEEDENEPEEEGLNDEDDPQVVVDNLRMHSSMVWADKFILETWCKSGRQTENSVLKLWKVWPKKHGNFSESKGLPASFPPFRLGLLGQ